MSADELVLALLEHYRIPAAPPIDLERLAHAMGVQEIVEDRRMFEDGRLEHAPGRTVIYLRAGTNPARRRFTLAHELGHLARHNPDAPMIARRMLSSPTPEERFCDQFAAALLLPHGWLVASQLKQRRDLTTLRALASAAHASLAATLLRLRELAGWDSTLLRWRHDEGRWRLVATVGTPPELHCRVRSIPATLELLDRLRAEPDGMARVPLEIDGATAELWAQVSIGQRGGVALTRLPETAAR
jgi:IrrE N-terminal-like domain